MAISVRNLEPINLGIPTHAPKLWKMSGSIPKDSTLKTRWGRLRFFGLAVDPIDNLEPLERIWSVD